MKNIIKYGVLVILGLVVLYQYIPIGDYCSGLLNFLNFLFYGGLLLLAFLVISIIDLVRYLRKKQKFDFIPLILIVLFGTAWSFLYQHENEKFWTAKVLEGYFAIEGTPRSGNLTLYKNGSFGATLYSADYDCTFQGEYSIENGKLTLHRRDLNSLTNDVFTTEYLVDKKDNILKPIDRKFETININRITKKQ